MFDWVKHINLAYLFGSRPDSDLTIIILTSLFGAAVVASGLVWLIFAPRVSAFPPIGAIRTRLVNLFVTIGLGGLILTFFRWQAIPFLGNRIWLWLWLLVILVWSVLTGLYLLKKFPEERRLFVNKRQYERYLPRSSGKKKRG